MKEGHSLLIVEDDQELREILHRAMTRRGFQVSACDGCEESLRLARETQFQAALVDGNLCGQDGIVLLRQLKQMQPRLRVIVLSGQADRAAKDRAIRAGASAYLSKPCSLADLRATIDSALIDMPCQEKHDDLAHPLTQAGKIVAASSCAR